MNLENFPRYVSKRQAEKRTCSLTILIYLTNKTIDYEIKILLLKLRGDSASRADPQHVNALCSRRRHVTRDAHRQTAQPGIDEMDTTQARTSKEPQTDKSVGVLAAKLKVLRWRAKLTLQQLSERSKISASTLSKIENGQLSPTYEKIAALASALSVDVGELFNSVPKPTPLGRRSVTLKGEGVIHRTEQYIYEVLNADLADKRFVPLTATIKAGSLSDFPALLRHDGEEFLYVLSGKVVIHTDFYAPFELNVGDACYFDSTMGHALIKGGEEDAQVLWVCSNVSLP